jgi:ubiquinone/menaquinone biosynthesis C-methylase UbiE
MKEGRHHQTEPNTHGKVLHWPFLYDVLLRVLFFGNEDRFRQRILDLALLQPGNSVLDIGCGTGTLVLAAERRVGSGGRICGIDASRQMIGRATTKAARAGSTAEFRIAPAETLPFPDGTFDVVLSTLMLHHLPEGVRIACLHEALRVLKKGGRLLAVDFAGTAGRKKGPHGLFGRHQSLDLDQLVQSLKEIGFGPIETGETGFFNLRYFRASSPQNR